MARALSAEAAAKAARIIVQSAEAELSRSRARVQELEDRLQASSLAELRAFHPVAMPDASSDPDAGYEFLSDPTGLVTERVKIDRAE